jgi:hypothetical protein
MRKTFYVAMLFMVTVLTGCATTRITVANSERIAELNGKKIFISETELLASPSLVKINVSEIKKGVYIYLNLDPYDKSLPNTKKLITKIFTEHGIKISDSVEGADIAISFKTGSFEAGDIENQLDHSKALSDTAGGLVLAANMFKATNGVSLISMFIPHDEVATINAGINRNPVVFDGRYSKLVQPADVDSFKAYGVVTKYRLSSKKEEKANEAELFAVEIEEWINAFMVPETLTPVASVK